LVHHSLDRVRAEAVDGVAVLAREATQRAFRERKNVRRASPQRGHLDVDDVEPVVEVLAEPPAAISEARSRWVAATMRTSTFERLVASDPLALEGPLLKETEQPDLQANARSLLISSKRRVPPSARLKRPSRQTRRPGEGPALVTEELTLEHGIREGRGVELDEDGRRAAARLVDGPSDELLAGAVLAGDEQAGAGGADPSDEIEHAPHRRADSDQIGEPRASDPCGRLAFRLRRASHLQGPPALARRDEATRQELELPLA
jgi:hypothetical protein